MKIVISSGKGGTGKTFLATNLARILEQSGKQVRYLDCDVEAPNGHLFLNPEIKLEETVHLLSPSAADPDRCTSCGACVLACQYNAIVMVQKQVMFFENLCHICGACTRVCPADAVIEKPRDIGILRYGQNGGLDFHDGRLKTGEGGMSPVLIRRIKRNQGSGINIMDSPPGTACPVVETVRDADLCVLVTDPTPFGLHDLRLSVSMCRDMNLEPAVIINRADFMNDALKDYCRTAGLEVLGEIPDDRRIAEACSNGSLVVDTIPEYRELMKNLAASIIRRAENPGKPRPAAMPDMLPISGLSPDPADSGSSVKPREIVVVSGKGGTGKTSLTACFFALEAQTAVADCDVDASDLPLVLQPEMTEGGGFSGGDAAVIDPEKCTGCGACEQACRFGAIAPFQDEKDGSVFIVDEKSCEGCRVCSLACPEQAVRFITAVHGEWRVSKTRFGLMSHARLSLSGENSGKLVTLVRKHAEQLARRNGLAGVLIDGSPGIGCPVIASVTGADYAVVVTEPTVSGLHDLNRILDLLRFFRIASGVIVNKSDINPEKAEEIRPITEQSGSDFLGMIPYDRRITEAQVNGMTAVEFMDTPVTQTIRSIWNRIRERCLLSAPEIPPLTPDPL
ncbi:P-loop NTPase [bacterium]|nr:P-loop NTPase [bacterium]